MTRDNNTLIYDAIGHNFTPAQVHDLAATVATPEQIAEWPEERIAKWSYWLRPPIHRRTSRRR